MASPGKFTGSVLFVVAGTNLMTSCFPFGGREYTDLKNWAAYPMRVSKYRYLENKSRIRWFEAYGEKALKESLAYRRRPGLDHQKLREEQQCLRMKIVREQLSAPQYINEGEPAGNPPAPLPPRVVLPQETMQVPERNMFEVPCEEKALIYCGISHDGLGSKKYLKIRNYKDLEEKYCFPNTVNHEYGWCLKSAEILRVPGRIHCPLSNTMKDLKSVNGAGLGGPPLSCPTCVRTIPECI